MGIPMLEEEIERQQTWFESKSKENEKFMHDIKQWLMDAKGSCELENSDDIQPNDSISNVSSHGKGRSISSSKVSTTSSAYIKAKAEKAALLQRMSALEKKHVLEAQQESLKRQKEHLMETELAVANDKLAILECSEVDTGSDGMNSYYSKEMKKELPEEQLPQSSSQ